MTNDTSLESFYALLLESAKKTCKFEKIVICIANVCKKISKKDKITILKST